MKSDLFLRQSVVLQCFVDSLLRFKYILVVGFPIEIEMAVHAYMCRL